MRRVRLLLLPFSIIFYLLVVLRNWFFDIGILKIKKAGVPVISVGNISAGGTGKTPFVEMLIEKLEAVKGLAVVSRGYGRKTTGTVVVSDGRGNIASADDSGDEPVQLAQKFSKLIIVDDEVRVRGARKAVDLGAELIVLDDGFQHRYIHRDMNIVLLTAEEILKGDLMLPAGNRREPFSSLKRADLLVITRCTDKNEYERAYDACVNRNKHIAGIQAVELHMKLKAFKKVSSNRVAETGKFANKKIVAFSGIGNPGSFEDVLANAKVRIMKHLVFPDHHWYSDADIRSIIETRRKFDADCIVTTEKDAARLVGRLEKELRSESIYAAEIHMEVISGKKILDAIIKKFMN
jgi:tetraacyldisaccharide 4'-kinase